MKFALPCYSPDSGGKVIFVGFFGKKFNMSKLKPKQIWISHKYIDNMAPRNDFWAGLLGVSTPYVKKSWEWAKTKFCEGKVRDLHYKLRQKSLFTNDRVSHFTDTPNSCFFCTLHGMDVLRTTPTFSFFAQGHTIFTLL